MANRFQTLYTTGDITPEMEELGIQDFSAYKGSPQLISQVPGEQFTDISYDPYGQTAYSDLYNLYYGGGFDAAQPDFVTPPADTTPVDTNVVGGGATLPGFDVDSPKNTPFEQNLIDQGAGVQGAPGDPVVAPGEMPVTQEEMDAFNQIPVTPVNEFPTGDASLAEKIAAEDRAAKALADEQALTNLEQARTGQYDAPTETYIGGEKTLADAGAGIDNMYGTDWQGTETDPFLASEAAGQLPAEEVEVLPNIMETGAKTIEDGLLSKNIIPKEFIDRNDHLTPNEQEEKYFYETGIKASVPIGSIDDPIMDPNLMDIRQDQLVSEQDAANPKGLLEKIGLGSLDPAKTAVMAAINNAVGAPVSLLISALEALPQYEPTFEERTLEGELGVTADGKFAGNPNTSAFAGLNAVSAFGDPVGTAKDRIDTRLETIAKKGYKPGDKFYDDTKTMEKEWEEVTDKLGDIDEDPLGDQQIAEETYADIDREKGLEELSDVYSEIGQTRDAPTGQDKTPSGPTGQDIHGGDGPSQDSAPSAPSGGPYGGGPGGIHGGETTSAPTGISGPPGRGGTATTGPSAPPSQGGGGGGGGKSIVCTAMYQTTGLEDWSKAMKIWYIYQKKYLTIQHQEGYHKLFKPFVKGMHKSSIIKAIGAHVARHRTQDLKHVMFGSKPSWLGRVYRKVLEPICYWVGKYAKR